MSTEEKSLPDFSRSPKGVGDTVTPAKGLPRAPRSGRRLAEPSAFTIIESDEVSRTLDFGMSEEDLEDVSDGEGSSSDLHDSLRALHSSPDLVEDNFENLSNTYESGIREEDTYKKKSVSDAELPPLETSDELPPLDISSGLPSLETSDELPPLEDKPRLPVFSPASEPSVFTSSEPETPVMTRRERRLQEQTLPDFSKYDEDEKAEKDKKGAVKDKATPTKKAAKSDEKKISPKLLLIIAAIVVIVIAVVVVVFVLPGASAPGVATAPGSILSAVQITQLLQ